MKLQLKKEESDGLFNKIDRDKFGYVDIDELILYLSSNKHDVGETA